MSVILMIFIYSAVKAQPAASSSFVVVLSNFNLLANLNYFSELESSRRHYPRSLTTCRASPSPQSALFSARASI